MSEQKKRALDSVSRRSFLAVGGVGVVGLSLGEARTRPRSNSRAVIQIVMNGGPSQLDTFDPKPEAPREIRGPIRSIATSISGVHFAESLPKLAQRANELVILRSLHHESAPIHESGMQLLLTGSLVKKEQQPPNIGVVLNHALKQHGNAPVSVRLGGKVQKTGVNAYHGDGAGFLDLDDSILMPDLNTLQQSGFETPAFSKLSSSKKKTFGENRFGELLWTAARLIEAGVQYVEVNTFDHFEGNVTWDAHGCAKTAPGTIFDYRDTLGPQFDKAASALFDDLQRSGLWQQTLVVATGEMGRNPRINERNGRDHWTDVWSGMLAGGGLEGGQVIGESDATGEAIKNHPIHISEIAGLIGSYLVGESQLSIQATDDLTWSLPKVESLLS
ncbi:DUF1501 domain-containing protein [Thalassoglobus sp.]|uniref:DUF1501 domain-containing protein n=1 Tax=Thalassoglobus sp. TaxID=2795869 RepID=UPI003AA7AE97